MFKVFSRIFLIVVLMSSCDGEGSINNGQIGPGNNADVDLGSSDDTSPINDAVQTVDMDEEDASNGDASVYEDMDVIPDPDETFVSRSLESAVTEVQPMTGIVLWENSWNGGTTKNDIQIEYAYLPPNEIIKGKNNYDWTFFEAFLDRVAARGNQAMPRFYYAYVGRETVVPDYIKNLNGYNESRGTSEGRGTSFPDWSNQELQDATIDFLTEFAKKYDKDPRIAFLQVGFGLWGEYHIYDGPNQLGKDFPSYAFQKRFVEHLDSQLETLKWSISVDAGYRGLSAFPADPDLAEAGFGLFDDSFMHESHRQENEPNWDFFGYKDRHLTQPHGGEFSYYTDFDQRNVLNPAGLHGFTFEEFSKRFYISYMIGNDQPDYSFSGRIKEAGMATGYRFEVTKFESSDKNTRVEIKNNGIAPIYYDAFPAISGTRSQGSLKGLAPGASKVFLIASVGDDFSIDCDRLVAGQVIQFDADL